MSALLQRGTQPNNNPVGNQQLTINLPIHGSEQLCVFFEKAPSQIAPLSIELASPATLVTSVAMVTVMTISVLDADAVF